MTRTHIHTHACTYTHTHTFSQTGNVWLTPTHTHTHTHTTCWLMVKSPLTADGKFFSDQWWEVSRWWLSCHLTTDARFPSECWRQVFSALMAFLSLFLCVFFFAGARTSLPVICDSHPGEVSASRPTGTSVGDLRNRIHQKLLLIQL